MSRTGKIVLAIGAIEVARRSCTAGCSGSPILPVKEVIDRSTAPATNDLPTSNPTTSAEEADTRE